MQTNKNKINIANYDLNGGMFRALKCFFMGWINLKKLFPYEEKEIRYGEIHEEWKERG